MVEREVADRGEDHETDEHPDTANNHHDTTTEGLHNPQSHKGHAKVDSAHDDLGDIAVAETGGGEDGVTVVEDEVGAGELLQGLDANSKQGTPEHGGTSENFVPGRGAGGLLLFEFFLHFLQLRDDLSVVGGDTGKLAHDFAGLVSLALTIQETGGFRKEHDSEGEKKRPSETDAHGDTPGSGRVDSLSTEVDNVGNEDTESDEQLEGTEEESESWFLYRSVGQKSSGESRDQTRTKIENCMVKRHVASTRTFSPHLCIG